MKLHGVNISRFTEILVKRWKRNPDYRAGDLPELKSLTWYKEALPPHLQEEVCCEIEKQARRMKP